MGQRLVIFSASVKPAGEIVSLAILRIISQSHDRLIGHGFVVVELDRVTGSAELHVSRPMGDSGRRRMVVKVVMSRQSSYETAEGAVIPIQWKNFPSWELSFCRQNLM